MGFGSIPKQIPGHIFRTYIPVSRQKGRNGSGSFPVINLKKVEYCQSLPIAMISYCDDSLSLTELERIHSQISSSRHDPAFGIFIFTSGGGATQGQALGTRVEQDTYF